MLARFRKNLLRDGPIRRLGRIEPLCLRYFLNQHCRRNPASVLVSIDAEQHRICGCELEEHHK